MSQPKSNEEIIDELMAHILVPNGFRTIVRIGLSNGIPKLLAQKDKEVAEAYQKGQQLGKESVVSHIIVEFGLPFERTKTTPKE